MRDNNLPLTVTVPAETMAELHRRTRFVTTVLVQVLRERCRVKEWFTAAELADLKLSGLSASAGAITRRAARESWRSALNVRGQREYHYSALPERAFQQLVERVLAMPLREGCPVPGPTVTRIAEPAAVAANASPTWLLPLMRVVRAGTKSIDTAIAELRDELPDGAAVPTVEEARAALRAAGVRL